MRLVKVVIGIAGAVSFLGFKNDAPTVGLYFGVLCFMGIMSLFWMHNRTKNNSQHQ